MAKKQKMCSNPPVEFSQKAINLLFPLFPDSNGNLDADDVMTALWSHFGQGEKICFPTKGGKEYNEIYNAAEKLITSGKTAFSPVLPLPKPVPKPMNKPWDKKKAKAASEILAAQTTKFFAKCNDGDDASGENDFVVGVECAVELVDSFVANWDTCQTKAAKKREYSVNDIYALMAKKGYKVAGLFTKYTVGY